MTSLGTGKGTRPGKFTGLGTVVLAIVFLVALVLAANHNDVLGWFIAVVALGWLVLSTFVYIGVHKAAAFGAEQVRKVQAQMAAQAGGSEAGPMSGTRLVSGQDEATAVRDLKLDHSFKIIAVQAGVIAEQLGKDAGQVQRALETIQITAHNGRAMMKNADAGTAGGGQPNPGGTAGPDDDAPVSGTIVD